MTPPYRWLLPCLLQLLLLCSVAGRTLSGTGTPLPGWSDPVCRISRLNRFLEQVRRLQEELHIPGLSLAILRHGRVWWSGGLGYADLERTIPAQASTPYLVGSLSKPLAAMLVMQQVQQERLSLGDPVARFALKDFPGDGLRLVHLLSHSAEGPGDRYRYRSLHFARLGEILTQVTGMEYCDLVREQLIMRLGLSRSAPGPDSREARRLPVAVPYRFEEGQYHRSRVKRRQCSASFGFISTVEDLARIMWALDRGRLLDRDHRDLMWRPRRNTTGRTLPYALGWFVQDWRGTRLVWHYGWRIDSYSALLLRVPQRGVSLIMLANSDGLSAPFGLVYGNVLRSPVALAFLRLFVAEPELGQELEEPQWLAQPQVVSWQLEQARASAPAYTWANELVAQALISRANKDAAASLLFMESALRHCPEPEAYLDQGMFSYFSSLQAGFLWQWGRRLGEMLVARDPEDARLRLTVAGFYLRNRSQAVRQKAYPHLQRILRSGNAPAWARFLAVYALAEHYTGTDPVLAQRYLERAALLVGSFPRMRERVAQALKDLNSIDMWLAPLAARRSGSR